MENEDKLRKDIMKVLLPNLEQLNPSSWELAASRRKIDELMAVIKKFIEINKA